MAEGDGSHHGPGWGVQGSGPVLAACGGLVLGARVESGRAPPSRDEVVGVQESTVVNWSEVARVTSLSTTGPCTPFSSLPNPYWDWR